MDRPPAGDLIRMNPAEDQQMVVFRQMMQCPDRRPKALVLVQKAEYPDQYGVFRKAGQVRKMRPASAGASLLDIAHAKKRQRMIEDIIEAVEIFGVVEVAAVMHNDAHLLAPLQASQMICHSP